MLAHQKKYNYNTRILEKAKGILRIEFRLYASRLKNLKKSYPYNTVSDFLEVINKNIKKIINKNLRSLYLAGDFYKLDAIRDMIDLSWSELVIRFLTKFIKSFLFNLSIISFNVFIPPL